MSFESAMEIEVDKIRNNFLKFTRQAFVSLPRIEKPHILDFGCGSGNPTLELAKLSEGTIVGVDIDEKELKKLDRKIVQKGLSSRISTRKCSVMDIDFPVETFDIIWAEGSLHIVGFEKGLKKLRPLLKSKGFLVIHDGVKGVSGNLKKLPDLGYSLVNQFRLPDDEWWVNYFEPLSRLIKEYSKNPENTEIVEKYQNQLNMFRKNPKENISGFYVFQKTSC